jgi:acyl-coenzyme A thioesterase PaaI-like protein
MHIRFLSTVKEGPARAVCQVLRRGRRAIVVQCDVIDVGDDRKLVASATLSYTLLDSSTPEAAPAGS